MADETSDERAFSLPHGDFTSPGPRPELRLSPRSTPTTYRIRVALEDSEPVTWRRLDVRSDLTLDVVHDVLQGAFGWEDSHLHRFAIGGGPFDLDSQLFLCPFDVEEGEDEGAAASDVRLDEVVQEAGDVLRYVYDYGDGWELTLTLEGVRPVEGPGPSAVCVDGARAAPPEDSRGLTVAELPDPDAFDVDATNAAIGSSVVDVRELGLDPRLGEVVRRLRGTPEGADLVARVARLAEPGEEPEAEAAEAALNAYLWFLDRAQGDGMEMTASGYLRPAHVLEASRVVPAVPDWAGMGQGKNNRETHLPSLLSFRRAMQSTGLLRKNKGRLLLTKDGSAARQDLRRLWGHLAGRLVPAKGDDFEIEASLLLLVHLATGGAQPLHRAAAALGVLGWGHADGPVRHFDLYHLRAYVVLRNVCVKPSEEPSYADRTDGVSAVAAALARDALRVGVGRR